MSRQALVDVAVQIAQAEGLDALTMRRLAEATGRAPMTLYSHVASKEALLFLVADALLARVETPQGAWDSSLRVLSLSAWRTLGETPGLARFVWSHVPYFFTEQGLRLANAAIGLLIAGGFTPSDAGQALEALMTFITGHVQRREAWAATRETSPAQKVTGFPYLEAALDQSKIAGEYSAAELEQTFIYGLDLLLEGLRRDPKRRGSQEN